METMCPMTFTQAGEMVAEIAIPTFQAFCEQQESMHENLA